MATRLEAKLDDHLGPISHSLAGAASALDAANGHTAGLTEVRVALEELKSDTAQSNSSATQAVADLRDDLREKISENKKVGCAACLESMRVLLTSRGTFVRIPPGNGATGHGYASVGV